MSAERGEAAAAANEAPEFDAIVVGTGFAGAVTACRLVEAGLRVCVLERGRRYGPDDFPRYPTEELFDANDNDSQHFAPPPDFSRWLWSVDHGIYDVRDLGDVVSVQAAGYGGGSLIYANVHLRPPAEVFDHAWPDSYRLKALNPYFDLAAYMLRVAPIPQRLAKTVQLQRGADLLRREGDRSSWFRTPLAVRFDADGMNDYGRMQGACDMRGRCWRGCDHQAKNTLDLNYLARAEQGNPAQDRFPDIRTLADVRAIRPLSKDVLEVTYVDRRFRTKEDAGESRLSVTAGYVFLCAGAVNTTELLFKSPRLFGGRPADLGTHYFPNADSFSVAFDCDRPHEADYGPTITSALRYDGDADPGLGMSVDFVQIPSEADAHARADGPRAGSIVRAGGRDVAVLAHEPLLDRGAWRRGDARGALVVRDTDPDAFAPGARLSIDGVVVEAQSHAMPRRHWFLVEDGGYPSDLEPLVGFFRSPIWLRRNRFLELDVDGGAPGSAQRVAPVPRIRMRTFTDALAGMSRAAAPEGVLARSFDASRRGTPLAAGGRGELLLPGLLSRSFGTIFPEWFVKALHDDRLELTAKAGAFALPMLSRLLDELSENVAQQIDDETRERLSGVNGDDRNRANDDPNRTDVDGAKLPMLIRGMIRQALQVLAGSEAAVATKAARLLLDPVPGTPGQLLTLLGDVVLWAINYGTTNNHTGVLLTMGRDLYRGRLRFERRHGRGPRELSAALPSPVLDTGSGTQERVLRQIAREWSGELRTNPAWSSLRRRLTVHSQGGCPMGEAGRSVTNAEGQLHGCPRVYVMDAAAFPSSVGVNPSATIAAIAEWKVERFLRTFLGKPEWRAMDMDAARRWVDARRDQIDPLNHGALGANNPPAAETLGLKFTEQMDGFFDEVNGVRLIPDLSGPASWPLLRRPFKAFPFIRAEEQGVAGGFEIRTTLHPEVRDLGRLVAASDESEPAKFTLDGHVTIRRTGSRPAEETFDVVPARSFLQMFVRVSDRIPPTRYFIYHLDLVSRSSGAATGLDAIKVLCDAPGMDVWHDTATLFFEMRLDGRLARGVLRVSIESFLNTQMPSTEVTGTTDPARRSWALVAFYKYFAAQLKSVYSRRSESFIDLITQFVTSINV